MEQYIGFKLNAGEYMIPILTVREILKMPAVTELPQLPPYIKGVTNIRGSIIPIINLKSLLNAPGDENTSDTVIVISAGKVAFGIIVDSITGVIKADGSSIEPPERFAGNGAEHVQGVAKINGKLIVLLDTGKLLPLDDMSLLNDAIVEVSETDDGDKVQVVKEVETSGGKITVTELHDAREYFDANIDENDPRHNIFKLMLDFMDALSSHEYDKLEGIINQLIKATDSDLFKEVGRITRKLHNSLDEFKGAINHGLERLTKTDVPDAVDKLQFVIKKTEDAANKTMGIVERYFEESDTFSRHIENIKGHDESVNYLKTFKASLDNDMTDILTAQQFQDIIGQTIKKVIQLVHDVESELLTLIGKFGVQVKTASETDTGGQASNRDKTDVHKEKTVEKITQSDVEGLLNEFGF
ncbi:MAG: hypothetical protein GXP46_02230 [Deferribacteres bacterium]|nr:hypothetical protein [Deferribacteres bacterium]